MDTGIINSIKGHNIIKFYYNNSLRIVEPHCYGISKTGKDILRGFQISGQSSKNELGWKLFDVDKITDFEVLNDTFKGERNGYKRNDPIMKTIYYELYGHLLWQKFPN